jgi:carboxymethylenebutenolidase
LAAAFPFYGTGPEDSTGFGRITAPVHGFYGGNDARVNATIPTTSDLMKAAGKTYEPVIYEGARHGFMRAGEAPDADAADRTARDPRNNKPDARHRAPSLRSQPDYPLKMAV